MNDREESCGCNQTMTKECGCDEKSCCCEEQTAECDCVSMGKTIEETRTKIREEDLREVYKNACLGKISIEILEKFTQDKSFRNVLIKEYKDYIESIREIELYASEENIKLIRPSGMAKFMMYMTTAINTLNDKSSSKLSEIMLQGINMGIISLTKLTNKFKDEKKSCPCAENLLVLLNKNLEELKMFL